MSRSFKLSNKFLTSFICISDCPDYFIFSQNNAYLLIAYGRLSGLLLEYFILLQLILIGRIVFIEKIFGHDRLNRIHRLVGYCLAFFLISHPLLLSIGYSQSLQIPPTHQFVNFLFDWENVGFAFLAVLLLIGIIIFSISRIRRKVKYESWHFVHLFTYLAVGLAFGHQIETADLSYGPALYYWLVLNFVIFGLVLFYRWLKPFYLFYKHRFYVDRVVLENNEVVSVYVKGNNLADFKYQSGQFANLIFLVKHYWTPHPFSFSIAPNGNYLRFSMKGVGDFTNFVSQISVGTKVIIDGPLGVFTTAWARKEKFLFIAGGIGITPIRAMLEVLKQKQTDAALLYANRSVANTVFKKELDELSVNIFYLFSQEENLSQNNFRFGKVNDVQIKSLVPDYLEREIYICGPKPMMNSVIKFLKKMGVPKSQIHSERFGL